VVKDKACNEQFNMEQRCTDVGETQTASGTPGGAFRCREQVLLT